MSTIYTDLAAAVGNTPLIRLNATSEATGCEILGKAEFMNPGQSVKDRAALYIIKAAAASGDLRPGGTIVEGTAGNTGIGLALVGASMGYRTVIAVQSLSKFPPPPIKIPITMCATRGVWPKNWPK